jgi:hypothetical protein
MERGRFIEQQARGLEARFEFASGEEDVRQRFRQLALDTFDFVVAAGCELALYFDPAWDAGSAVWQKSSDGSRFELPQELLQRWQDWNREYAEVRARNPRLRLSEMLHAISESDNASSWPIGYERRIADWVEAGDATAPPPFDDRYGIGTPEFFDELRALRQRCGGWLYWNDHARRVVFAPEAEWQRVRAAQDEVEAAWRIKRQEMLAAQEAYLNRMPEILALARADKEFWEALRKWERDQEAHRASLLPLQTISGPVRLVNGRSANPPVDAMYRDFLARVLQPDDMLKPSFVASCIRIEIRRELGL